MRCARCPRALPPDQEEFGTQKASEGESQPVSSSDASSSPQGWLEAPVQLPGGRRTTRRDVLKLLPLGGSLACFYYAADNAKAFSYASPRGLLNALLPPATPVAPAGAAAGSTERVAAFLRFITDVERRGGGQVVPDFARGLDWLNAPPLSLSRELSGKLVVLDFWTYCCINCMHVLPDLAAVEAAFKGRPVAVVGVHSAKFDNEKDSAAIRNAVLRYDVTHPVVNDASMTMWGELGVSSWPTLALVSPKGRLLAMLTGEGHRQDLEDFLEAGLQYYGPLGLLKDTPVPVALERDRAAASLSPLRYPGKLTCDLAGRRIFISDSNNHRIVITGLDGTFIDQVGGNGATLRDGDFESAAFNRPQGVAFDVERQLLYVADTENHALRCVDLSSRRVMTLLGNGSKGNDYAGGGRGPEQALNSPWDVVLVASQPQAVFVALAGQHQLWQYDIVAGSAAPFSGTGSERNQNGSTGLSTAWAQPSGLSASADGRRLYVADSESSSVRSVDLATGGGTALAGGDPGLADNLFRFGDRDGRGAAALLQHPLAVCRLGSAGSELVYVADSYNHRIKVVDPVTGSVTTIGGSGRPGYGDGVGTEAQLSEPGGLAAGPDGTLLVADTNNSQIRILSPALGQFTTLGLSGVPPPRVSPLADLPPSAANAAAAARPPPGYKLVCSGQALTALRGAVEVVITLPPGYHLTKGAVSGFTAQVLRSATAPSVLISPTRGLLPSVTESPSFTVQYERSAGQAEDIGAPEVVLLLRVLVKVYFCEEEKQCLFEQVCFDVPFGSGPVVADGVDRVRLQHTVSAAAPAVSLL